MTTTPSRCPECDGVPSDECAALADFHGIQPCPNYQAPTTDGDGLGTHYDVGCVDATRLVLDRADRDEITPEAALFQIDTLVAEAIKNRRTPGDEP